MARDDAPGDPTTLIEFVLDSLATDRDLEALVRGVSAWNQASSTFPARMLLELAADPFAASGATRGDPLELDGLARRLLPGWPARGNAAHAKRRHCVNAAVLISAGAEPEDTSWWRLDDLCFTR